jgi:hypothetical protein
MTKFLTVFLVLKLTEGVSLAEMYQMSEYLLFENITQGGRPEYNKFSTENYVCFQKEDTSEICDSAKDMPKESFRIKNFITNFHNLIFYVYHQT